MSESFEVVQQAFMAHLRNPEENSFRHNIEDRRMAIYRELFFNNIVGFLDSGFPVLESLYQRDEWLALARKFFAQHDCRSPYFIDISKEFVEFLSNQYQPNETDPPFLQELAHYEWLELDVSVRMCNQVSEHWSSDKLPSALVMSELASLVGYQFPVHQISQEFQPDEPAGPVYLVVYRDGDDDVHFSLINAVAAHMLGLVQQHEQLSIQVLEQEMTSALPQMPPEDVVAGLHQTIKEMLKQQILLPVG